MTLHPTPIVSAIAPTVAPSGPTDLAPARRVFGAMWFGTLLLKLALAAWFPFTGDEAFFYQWGVFPAWGYSDHPPMVGWWLVALRTLGEHPFALRLATVAVTSVVALGLVDLARRLLPPEQEARAWWAGAVYLAMPWSWLLVLVTTDTPLLLFMALSAWCFVRAEGAASARGRVGAYALAGLFIGLAFLSKYFAALLGLAYAVYVLGWRRGRWWVLPWMFLFALPAIALNLWFNATHGWPNILFNFYNRNEGSHWQWQTLAVYLGMMLYLFTPWLCWQAARARGTLAASPARTALARTVQVLWLFPLLVFALLALRRSIGLHWVLGFVPLFVLWAAPRLNVAQWRRCGRWTLALSLPHLLLVLAVLATPLVWWQHSKVYEKLVFLREMPTIVQTLEQGLPPGGALMAHAYSPAALLAYHHKAYVPVYGVGRHHARQDDQLVDFRAWNGRTVHVLFRSPIDLAAHAPYFDRVSERHFDVAGVRYHVLQGEGFRYPAYRDGVLAEVARQFHAVPAWLPIWGSPFCERYGFADCAPGR